MVYLLLKNHDIKFDLVELVKIFFPGREIVFIQREEDYLLENILISNIVYEMEENSYSNTKVLINGKLINESTVNIDEIQVYENSNNRKLRIGIKKSIYDALINLSDIELPWGILTGIRPVKIAHALLDKNIKNEEILNILTREYKLDNEKARLLLEIGKKQRKYIYPIKKNKFSLYISIPFCPSKCLYCSFPSLSINRYKDYIKEYISTLNYEIMKMSEILDIKEINTVYFGGGTPTAIPSTELEKTIQLIYRIFGESNIKEITVEAGRPTTLTKEYLNMLKRNNIERISINPQTMNNDTLRLIGRKHSANDIIRSFNLAKEIGFRTINMDIIIGLPGEGLREIKHTLEEIRKLSPENITVHTLSVKRGSKFKDTIDSYSLESQDTLKSILDETRFLARDMGLKPYYLYRQKQTIGNFENIGYSIPNRECIYNIAMMEEKETIIGVGFGAVSKIYIPKDNRIKRIPNFKDLNQYFRRVDELVDKREKILKGDF